MKSVQRMRGIAVLAFMFALTSAATASTYSAKSYVQEGLYAQWDGIENAGWGTHDSAAQKPIELAGGGFLLVADGLFEDIPGISEFPQKGLVILFR